MGVRAVPPPRRQRPTSVRHPLHRLPLLTSSPWPATLHTAPHFKATASSTDGRTRTAERTTGARTGHWDPVAARTSWVRILLGPRRRSATTAGADSIATER